MWGIARPAIPRIIRKGYHLSAERRSTADVRALEATNLTSTESVRGDAPAVVSMTTHGERLRSVHLAIESIARGDVRPARMILWLDDAAAFADLPAAIVRLMARGLEVRLTNNYGPHTKYWPYVSGEAGRDDSLILVTADDDVLVPKYWLRRLIAHATPTTLACYRAHVVGVRPDGSLAPYNDWAECWTTRAGFANFPTGVSGIAYPAALQTALRERGTAFTDCTPRADDVWLHHVSVEAGLPTRQVFRLPLEFPLAPESQAQGLFLSNVGQSRNDDQIAATYSDLTRRRISDALGIASYV